MRSACKQEAHAWNQMPDRAPRLFRNHFWFGTVVLSLSAAILRWLTDNGIKPVNIQPGKLWENGTEESFNGRLRDECLNQEWFR